MLFVFIVNRKTTKKLFLQLTDLRSHLVLVKNFKITQLISIFILFNYIKNDKQLFCLKCFELRSMFSLNKDLL